MIPNIIVISGASRGFGQASAIALSAAFPQASFHLHASSAKSLESTQALLPGSTSFKLHGIDLAKLAAGDSEALKAAKSLQEAIQSDVASTKAAGEQGKVLFVHSAAILGPTGPLEGILGDKPESEAFALFTQAAQVNVAGSLAFASLVAKCTNPAQDLACINVSTKCAVLPGAFDLFDVYSITKSAVSKKSPHHAKSLRFVTYVLLLPHAPGTLYVCLSCLEGCQGPPVLPRSDAHRYDL